MTYIMFWNLVVNHKGLCSSLLDSQDFTLQLKTDARQVQDALN